jgi:pimeloyl-ACP methyl ester carboxylesterase
VDLASHTVPRSGERILRANAVDLCVETFGDTGRPAILLVGGAAMSMDWWEDDFCELLAAGPRFVIRYDHRDTGRSVSYPPGAPGYTGADLVADAVGVLDALGISRGHVVGVSMGGGIAQDLALTFPERVATLALMSTSPSVAGGPERPDLPPSSVRIRALFASPPPPPDWSDREAVVDHLVADWRAYEGSIRTEDAALRALVSSIVDRTVNVASSTTNHFAIEDGEPVRGTLGDIAARTLVVHGTEDPLFPIAHGETLEAEIRGARLLRVEGMGHQVPPRPVWDEVVAAILEHTLDNPTSR